MDAASTRIAACKRLAKPSVTARTIPRIGVERRDGNPRSAGAVRDPGKISGSPPGEGTASRHRHLLRSLRVSTRGHSGPDRRRLAPRRRSTAKIGFGAKYRAEIQRHRINADTSLPRRAHCPGRARARNSRTRRRAVTRPGTTSSDSAHAPLPRPRRRRRSEPESGSRDPRVHPKSMYGGRVRVGDGASRPRARSDRAIPLLMRHRGFRCTRLRSARPAAVSWYTARIRTPKKCFTNARLFGPLLVLTAREGGTSMPPCKWLFQAQKCSSGGLGSRRFPSTEASPSPRFRATLHLEARWSRGRARESAMTGLASSTASTLGGSRSHGRARESVMTGLVLRQSTSAPHGSRRSHGRACNRTRTGLGLQLTGVPGTGTSGGEGLQPSQLPSPD